MVVSKSVLLRGLLHRLSQRLPIPCSWLQRSLLRKSLFLHIWHHLATLLGCCALCRVSLGLCLTFGLHPQAASTLVRSTSLQSSGFLARSCKARREACDEAQQANPDISRPLPPPRSLAPRTPVSLAQIPLSVCPSSSLDWVSFYAHRSASCCSFVVERFSLGPGSFRKGSNSLIFTLLESSRPAGLKSFRDA